MSTRPPGPPVNDPRDLAVRPKPPGFERVSRPGGTTHDLPAVDVQWGADGELVIQVDGRGFSGSTGQHGSLVVIEQPGNVRRTVFEIRLRANSLLDQSWTDDPPPGRR